MSRLEFPAKIKDQAYARCKGFCENKTCGLPLRIGGFAYDHILPDAFDGKPVLTNCQVLCLPCHVVKTAIDIHHIRKADRQRKNHIGASVKPKGANQIRSAGFRSFSKPSKIGAARIDKSALPPLPKNSFCVD